MSKIQITMSEEHYNALKHKMQYLEPFIDYNDPGFTDSLVLDIADAFGGSKSPVKIKRLPDDQD